MDPRIWGPGAWLFLHSVTLNYPQDPTPRDEEEIKQFFMLVGKILPCFYCRDHYSRHLKEFPIQTGSKKDLVYWLIDIHNDVNKELGKPKLSRQEAMDKILCMYRKQPQNSYAYHGLYFGILLILIITCLINIKR
jgi:hypothetical protein